MTQPLDLAPIQAREAATSLGPWRREGHGPLGSDTVLGYNDVCVGAFTFGDDGDADADREFTLNARTDVPALIAEVTRLRAELATVETRIAAVLALPTATRDQLEQMDPEDYQQAVGYSNALWKVQQTLTGDDPYEGVCFAGTGAPAAMEG